MTLREQYEKETGLDATYIVRGSTYHFLGYVCWLESRCGEKGNTCEVCGEKAAVSLCYKHFTQRLKDEAEHPF
jgi:hypothetical protein